MGKKQKKEKSKTRIIGASVILPVIELVLLCLWGGIYDFTFAVYGAVFFAVLWFAARKGQIRIPRNITTYALEVILVCYLISMITAQDKGIAFEGVLRIIMLAGFWLLWSNLGQNLRRKAMEILPDIAAGLTVAAILLYFIPAVKEYLYQADRLGGVFQYSNTYALFLLISLVVLFYRQDGRENCVEKHAENHPENYLDNRTEHKEKKEYIKYGKYVELIVLLCGILFCGSRSVMVLAVITVVLLLVLEKRNRKTWILVITGAAAAGLVLQLLLHLDLGRLLKLTLDSSTLNGRFLYWQDAWKMISKNPLGLGYMGYYFLQPQYQTGYYITKFVHNDILQIALDAGVIAMGALVILFIVNIWDKKNAKVNRIVLTLLFLHSLFDFDLQFSAMSCIMLMCCAAGDSENGERISENRSEMAGKSCGYFAWKGKSAGIVTAALGAVFIFFSIALGLGHFGIYDAALAMYPGNTFAREERMLEDAQEKSETGATSENNQNTVDDVVAADHGDAEKIIESNGMLVTAYECAASQHFESSEYMEAYEDLQGMMDHAGFQTDYYNQAVYGLSIALGQAVQCEDYEGAQEILEEIQGVPERLTELEERSSKLAYKINDKPDFVLEEEIEEYIESLSGVSLE